jgi:hypothetical protein
MKKIFSILIAILLFFTSTLISFAETTATSANLDNVSENPDIKIIIDGNQGTYSSIPIVVNGRTLLPLREILVNLGVQNDDQHIIWNGSESSITIKKDTVSIYLKVDDANATVNNLPTSLDAAPINYKGKVYIPTRFIAQSFNRKVIWDGKTKSILITNENQFNDARSILKASNVAMGSLGKFSVKSEYITEGYNGNDDIDTTQVDNMKKVTYGKQRISDNNGAIESEIYTSGMYQYYKCANQNWEKNESVFNYNNWLKSNNTLGLIPFDNDVLCYGVTVKDNGNTYTLSGNVYPIIEDNSPDEQVDYSKMNIEIQISKDNSYVTSLIENCTYKNGYKRILKFSYSDFNGDFNIESPI